MGSSSFTTTIRVDKTTSDQNAFQQAVDRARHEHGSGGYSGTLAEKSDFVLITKAKSHANAERIASALMNIDMEGISLYREEAQALVDDKWGPAGAIRYPIDTKTDGLLFFGYASC